MPEFLSSLLTWTSENPSWAYFVVFLIAFLESVLLVGAILPGVPLLLVIGALVAMDAFGLLPAIAWATAGSIVGGAFSFALGYRYRDALRESWPLSTVPWLVTRGDRFFHRHGTGSVIFGRFMGPVRPILPTIAGMSGMSPARFLVVDIIASMLWAPIFIFIGLILGASMELATEIGSRMVPLLLIIVLGILLLVWGVRWFNGMLVPRIGGAIERLLAWSAGHRPLRRLSASIADPYHPEFRGLAILTALLTLAAGLILVLTRLPGRAADPLAMDHGISWLFGQLRNPAGDQLMLLLAQAGDWQVWLVTVGFSCLFLLFRRHYAAAWHWLAALVPPLVFALGSWLWLRGFEAAPGNAVLFLDDGAISVAVWLFFAAMVAHRSRENRRWLVYSLAAAGLGLMMMARLYLDMQWFSQLLTGVLLALVWIALLGMAYRRHSQRLIPARTLLNMVLPVFFTALAIHWSFNFVSERDRLLSPPPVTRMPFEAWWQGGGQGPDDNLLLRPGSRPQIQWHGELDAIRTRLKAAGWREPARLSGQSVAGWLRREPDIADLPVMPVVHDGRNPDLMLIWPRDSTRQWLLFFWKSGVEIAEDDAPVWLAWLTEQHHATLMGLVHYPRTLSPSPLAPVLLAGFLDSYQRTRALSGDGQWFLITGHKGD
jgi:membrane protein DedA with SNARE-associated domain